MLYALSWFFVLGLLAIWSLGAWAVHSMATWAVANAGMLAEGSASATLRLPDWLAPWVPPQFTQELASMLAGLMPTIEGLLAWAPALASGLSVMVWVVWGVGAALLVALGLLLSGTIAMLRRRSRAVPHASRVATPAPSR